MTTTLQAEIKIVNAKIAAAREAVNGFSFNYFRRVRRVLRSIDMANNAEICRVNYAANDAPQAEVFFIATSFAAEGIERDTNLEVTPFVGSTHLIVIA